ncbi:MAG: hypothetical protein WDO15_11995 [Bacteroidota bacterium]
MKRTFGVDELGYVDFPAKISNVQLSRIVCGEKIGCSRCFPTRVRDDQLDGGEQAEKLEKIQEDKMEGRSDPAFFVWKSRVGIALVSHF